MLYVFIDLKKNRNLFFKYQRSELVVVVVVVFPLASCVAAFFMVG